MRDPTREAVVVVTDADQYQDIIEILRRSGTVTQQLPPTLALVLFPAGLREQIPGATVYVDDVPPDVINDLSPQEQLFIRAWQARRATKARPSNQLPWDAPGHTPPN